MVIGHQIIFFSEFYWVSRVLKNQQDGPRWPKMAKDAGMGSGEDHVPGPVTGSSWLKSSSINNNIIPK